MSSVAKVYKASGGDSLVVQSGGTIAVETGGDITHNGTSLIDEIAALSGLDSGELGVLNAVTAGAWAASKVCTLDASKVATLPEACNLATGTTTGTKIGTAVSQKLGFWNATPIVQPAGAAQGAVAAPTAYSAHASGATPVTSNAATDLDTTAAALATAVTELTALRNLVDAMRTALVNAGIIKGAA